MWIEKRWLVIHMVRLLLPCTCKLRPCSMYASKAPVPECACFCLQDTSENTFRAMLTQQENLVDVHRVTSQSDSPALVVVSTLYIYPYISVDKWRCTYPCRFAVRPPHHASSTLYVYAQFTSIEAAVHASILLHNQVSNMATMSRWSSSKLPCQSAMC